MNDPTPNRLFEAIQGADERCVTQLLSQHPSLATARNEAGLSALLAALYARQTAIADQILAAGAELDLFEAAAVGRTDVIVEALTPQPNLIAARTSDGFTALHLACFFAQPESVRRLLDHGAAVDAVAEGPSGLRPLHSAAAARSTEIVRLLLEAGADANVQQHGGWTPLHAAAQHGDVEIATLLIARGAKVGAPADNGATPTDLAESHGHRQIVELLT